jgi:DNA polymerase V
MLKKLPLTLTVYDLFENSDIELPALVQPIPAGQPTEIADEIEMVDLHYLIVKDTPDAVLLRVQGDSMIDEIGDGDWIVVSPTIEPKPGEIIVARVNGGLTLKRYKLNDSRGRSGLFLVPSNGEHQTRELTLGDDVRILGVVTTIIKKTRRP